ncbi:hypothetical protein TNCV_3569881 [Trichonephila clavipes]|nr:hypothetical protein TNCV_3569881 [Trichonephila clavipes]
MEKKKQVNADGQKDRQRLVSHGIKERRRNISMARRKRKKEDSIESESDLGFHEEDIAVEIIRTDSGTTLIGTSPDKTNDHDTLKMIFSSQIQELFLTSYSIRRR